MEDRNVYISTKAVVKLLVVVLVVYLLYLVWNIVLLLFVSLILAALIDPFARYLKDKKIPRGVAVLIIYIVLFGIIGGAIALLAPIVARDVPQLLNQLQQFWQQINEYPLFERFAGDIPLPTQLGQESMLLGGDALSRLFSTVTGFVQGIFSFILVLVITFYMVVQEDPLRKVLKSMVPDGYLPKTLSILEQIRDKLGAWMRGQLILSVSVGLLSFVGLSLLGVPYAAVIALITALLEFVPFLGPILSAIPAVFFGFTDGGWVKALLVVGLYIGIQQVENHVLAPKVMQHAVGLNPIVSIVAILIGAELAGILGALIALPVATGMRVIVKELWQSRSDVQTNSG